MLCFIAGSNLRRKGQRKQEEAWTRTEEKDREGAGMQEGNRVEDIDRLGLAGNQEDQRLS